MPLNIDWQQILLHLFNFVILFAVLYFLLYQPVKQFMDQRTEYYKNLDDEARARLADAEKAKEAYLGKLESAEDEISDKREQARREMEEMCTGRIRQAESEAAKIVTDAHRNMENERAKMMKEVQNEISDMVVSATEKIVLQSSTAESYEQFLAAVERGGANGQEQH